MALALRRHPLPAAGVKDEADAESEPGYADDGERYGVYSVVVAQAVAVGGPGTAVIVRCPFDDAAAQTGPTDLSDVEPEDGQHEEQDAQEEKDDPHHSHRFSVGHHEATCNPIGR